MVIFGVVRGQSSDHSGLGSLPKLNLSVTVTPACAADTACVTPECVFPPLVGHVSVHCGRVFLQLLVLGATNHHAYEGSLTAGLGLVAVVCCAVVADELQAKIIYKHVEGVKAVCGTRVGSVGIPKTRNFMKSLPGHQ